MVARRLRLHGSFNNKNKLSRTKREQEMQAPKTMLSDEDFWGLIDLLGYESFNYRTGCCYETGSTTNNWPDE